MRDLPDGAETSIARGRPRLLFATLMLGLLPQGLGLTVVGPVLPEMAREFGARGAFVAQMMMTSVGLGLMLGSITCGWILERVGARSALLGSLLVFGSAGSAGLFIREPVLLLTSRLIVGFASSCAMTTCLWGVAAAYQANRRARAFGISGALSGATGFLSTILAGYLAQLGGWRLAFVQFPIFGIAVFLLARSSIARAYPLQGRCRRLGAVVMSVGDVVISHRRLCASRLPTVRGCRSRSRGPAPHQAIGLLDKFCTFCTSRSLNKRSLRKSLI